MGAGIAQLAAAHGHTVVLEDTDSTAILRATNATMKNLERLVEKGRVTDEEAKAIRGRIQLTVGDPSDSSSLDDFRDCAVVVEAVIENLDAKRSLFARLES